MCNVLDYLYWRGDLSFEQDPLNEVDALIFSEFSYIDFNLLAPEALQAGQLTIKKAANLWKEADRALFMPTGYLHHEQAYEALTLAGASKRFGEILIAEDIKELSVEDQSQFGVTVFHKNEVPFFIAFEGTDLRSIGWKEDLQMSYLPQIPSQKKAAAFLNHHFEQYPQIVSMGGHSKGSNLAIYASIFIQAKHQSFIREIYSFDGPGFMKSTLKNESYHHIKTRIKSFVPQDSIIGLMMHKLEEPNVVYSHASDADQHDVFTWEIKGNRFVPSALTDSAKQIQQMMNDLMDELSLEDRENFSEALFSIIGDGEDDYIMGDRQFRLERIPRIILEFTKLDADAKQILLKVLRLFYRKRLELI